MWKLKHVKKVHLESYLFMGEEFVIGRKDASLLITNDPSVSRKHAVLCVKHTEENRAGPNKKSSLFLRDEKSKYGTFKNGLRVTTEVELMDGDIVKFGQFESEYRVHVTPLVVTTSCLELSAKRDLRNAIHTLGGHFIAEWQPTCSHLVMTEVQVTVKALCCLVSAKPIVTPDYFQKLKESLKQTSEFINPNQFIPPIGEALIDKDHVSFDINIQRKTLFEDRTFYFLDEKQFKKLHLGIVLGAGKASVLTPNQVNSKVLLENGCCVIEPVKEMLASQELKDLLPTVISILNEKKLRLIPESDIGLAVTYCTTEKFCNPQVNINEIANSQRIQSQTLTQQEVFVPDTLEQSQRQSSKCKNPVSTAHSSLHLSSFNCGEDVPEVVDESQVPLSAQIKRELDDLFVESKAMDISPLRSAPVSTKTRTPERTPKRQKRSAFLNQNRVEEEVHPPSERNGDHIEEVKRIISPSRNNSPVHKLALREVNPEVEIHVSIAPEQQLPRNLMKIEFVSLICRKQAPIVQYQNSDVKNFKKFKKVLPKRAHALPRIIGAHELVPYDKIAAQVANEVWEDPEEVGVLQPVKGEFDWDTPTV